MSGVSFGRVIATSATAGALWSGGDAVAQYYEGIDGDYDWKRTMKLASIGALALGPIYTYWYAILEAKTAHITSQVRKIATKVVVDQFLFEPPMLAGYFLLNGVIDEGSVDGAVDLLRREYLTTYAVDCGLWIPVQTVNFTATPVHLQPVVVTAVSVLWTSFLSHVAHRDHEGDVAAARAAVDLAFSDNDPDPVGVPDEPAMSDAGDFDSPANDAAPPTDHKGDVAAASDAVDLAFPAIDPDPVEVPDEPGKSDAE